MMVSKTSIQKTPQNYPSISIITPTYNSAKTLTSCLESIKNQDYEGEIEIIIADGGSTDATLEIARRYTDKIYPNPLKTGEAGKAVGVKHARNEIIALIDSDNILPSRDWLSRMKNFKKVLSKTFKKGLSNEGVWRHTPIRPKGA